MIGFRNLGIITRRIEFDAAHRIPEHTSKCRNLHGHRYVLEATISGLIHRDGMVVDFGILKTIMQAEVGNQFDHALLAYSGDELIERIRPLLPDWHKTILLPFVPSVENLVVECFSRIEKALPKEAQMHRVRLYETPNCYADVYGESFHENQGVTQDGD